jgi:hypothetical protein
MKIKRWSWLRTGPLMLLLLAALTSPAFGQASSANLTGTITDNSGAVLKDAKVTAVNQKTGVEYPGTTNDAGVYTIISLPPGSYVVKAEAQGFKSVTTNAVTLEVGQTPKVNLKLEVGGVAEEIEVVGVNPILQTENATVGEVISGSTVVALPLNGRNFAQLTLLTAGVQTHAPDSFTETQTGSSGRPYVNGQREQSNNFMLDGIDQNEAVDNLIAYYPNPDAVQEMRVETNNYSAEFGNVAGGVMTAVTKSGSNEFHGNLFEFRREDKFDANSWSNNRSGAAKGDFKQDIFGATFGGPLVKNKVFFFADYQGTRVDRPGPATATVAPEAFRRGDFSSVSTPIIDPLTGRQFPGNIIPSNRISPVAQKILSNTAFYPLPNRPGLSTGNLVFDGDSQVRIHQGDLKIDANLSPSDNLSIRGSINKVDRVTTKTAFPLIPGGGEPRDTQSFAVNYTRTFGPTAVNELRAGYSHVKIDSNPVVDDFGVGNYNGVVGIPGGQRLPGLSSISFGNSNIDSIGNNGIKHLTDNKTLQLNEKLSLSRGRHFLSVGGSILHYQMGQDYASNAGLLGSFGYNGGFTGFGFADFLLDQVASKNVGRSKPWEQRQNRIGLFVQDDFKVNSKLTLNLGVRWEYASPITEKDGQQVNFDVDPNGASTGKRFGEGEAGYDPYYGGFGPRLGFAWTASEKTVVRGGYGMVQYQEGTGANCRLPLNPPFFGEFSKNFVGTPGTITTGFGDVSDQTNIQLRAWQADLRPQLTQQFNVFVERQVSNAISLNVGYVGSRSTHVVAFRDINQALPGVGAPSTWAPYQDRRRLASVGITGPVRWTSSDARMNYNGLQASLRQRRAHGLEFMASYTLSRALGNNPGFYGPGWGGYSANSPNTGLGGDGSYNSYNMDLDYGPLWFSSKHTGVLSGNYELPIGKSRAIGKDWSGVTQALLGGWNVSAILTVRSGLPGTTTAGWGPGSSLQNSGFSFERPDVVAGQAPLASNPDWDGWLNKAAWKPAALGTFGNAEIGQWTGPGYYNLDMGLDKNFDLGGSKFITLRAEAFNILNHPNKGMPNRDFGGADFGKVLGTANAARVLEFVAKFVF